MKNLISVVFIFFIINATNAQLLKVDSLMLSYKYLVHVPAQKSANGKYPLLLFLHGAGERGRDINLVRIHNPISLCKDSLNFPFLLISPQCLPGQTWSAETLLWLLDEIEKKYPVDKDREYITGLSMGGYGTWALAQKAGDRFAAVAPVCGASDTSTLCMMRHIPVWAFHGVKDEAVPSIKSEIAIQKLQSLGAEAKLTLYPEVAHNSWDNAYSDPELYTWLLQHKRLSASIEFSDKDKLQYAGNYKYTFPDGKDTLNTYVLVEKGNLWYNVPRYNFKVKIYAVAPDLFRLDGVAFEHDSELKFERNAKKEIIGHRYYPCDNTFVPKVK